MTVECAFAFQCNGEELAAVIHKPKRPSRRGLLVVVGGPQYRAGSHRQFVLLARELADSGSVVMRFDYRGMGDSSGSIIGFEDNGPDLGAAIDEMFERVPEIEEVALWGLCDAATAVAFYAPHDERVTGIALVNPWVRSDEGIARSYLRHYYLQRVLSHGFWSKVIAGRFKSKEAASSLWRTVRHAILTPRQSSVEANKAELMDAGDRANSGMPLSEKMLVALQRFQGQILVILSGHDLTASEFSDSVAGSRDWRRLLAQDRAMRHDLPDADHTFSKQIWRGYVADRTRKWLVEYQ